MALTTVDQGLLGTYAQYTGLKNRIINGDMRIDQRNAGASVTPASGQYLVDRFVYGASQGNKFTAQQNAGSVARPAGFTNYLGMTVASAVSVGVSDRFRLMQPIEGLNISDLDWGSASAQPITLSFWIRSSLTGSFGGSVGNSAGNRSYPFPYTISAANTWEQKTVTIPGDTSGTWLATNGLGLLLQFNLGAGSNLLGTASTWAAADYVGPTGATSVVGTSGATFYITGVQLEVGSTATSFDRRDYGRELAMCQRYLPAVIAGGGSNEQIGSGMCVSTTAGNISIPFPVTARVPATGVTVSSASHYSVVSAGGNGIACTGIAFVFQGASAVCITFAVASGLASGSGTQMFSTNASAKLLFTGCEL